MKSLSTDDITTLDGSEFVQALEISEPRLVDAPELELTAAVAQGDKGYVNAGSVVSFVSGVSQEHQADVLNSFLLAQLAANKKFPREEKPREWYGFYRTVLEKVGWVIQQWSFTKFDVSGGRFSCDRAVLDVLRAIAGDSTVIVDATLKAMEQLSDNDGRIVLFERESHNLHQANFQVSIASERNNALSLSIGAFEFKSAQDIKRVLFFSWESSSSELYFARQEMTLNKDIYGQVRQDVITKLGSLAKKFVLDLEI